MGESVAEATLIRWLKEVGDTIQVDDVIVEIATDKVDTDVPSEVNGILIEKRFAENDVVQVGEVMAVIQVEGDTTEVDLSPKSEKDEPAIVLEELMPDTEVKPEEAPPTFSLPDPIPKFESITNITPEEKTAAVPTPKISTADNNTDNNNYFYSPLVRSIAKAEGLSDEELKQIKGTGKNYRVTKKDMLAYLKNRNQRVEPLKNIVAANQPEIDPPEDNAMKVIDEALPPIQVIDPIAKEDSSDEIIEMSRMAKLTADHMVSSKRTSAHVQSFIEADLTNLWEWREKHKHAFQKREGEKLTFTPLFMTALIKALKDFPLLNSSVEGNNIIQKRAINIGMATAMADGNLIVPVIKNADHLNLLGLSKSVNDLAQRARNQKLRPDEVQDGTFTFTNIGNFGSITGTPIINQPQVGIVAVGVIRKMPAVMESKEGDSIAIRKKVIISHSYDHRIINGAMGGQFIKSMTDFLENWDMEQNI